MPLGKEYSWNQELDIELDDDHGSYFSFLDNNNPQDFNIDLHGDLNAIDPNRRLAPIMGTRLA